MADETEDNGRFAWVIEMQGPAYLAVRNAGGYFFEWTENHLEALRFYNQEQADLVMMAVRQLRSDLFPSCLTRSPCAVEHKWLAVDRTEGA